MKFDMTSDLHLGFGGISLLPTCSVNGSEVLLLLGDTIEISAIKHKTSKGWREHVIRYLQALNANYKLVIYIMGNHEHYGNAFSYTEPNIQDMFVKHGLSNFILLENKTVEYNNVIFFGTTLWSTFRNRNPISMWEAVNQMNDYHKIYTDKHHYTKLQPEDTALRCEIAKKNIERFVAMETDKLKVLCTHMAPSSVSLGPNRHSSDSPYRNSYNAPTDPYYEELGPLLRDSDIKVACHGHIHAPIDYMIGNCRVVSNPRGYYSHEVQAATHKFLTIEV